jgi:hypothetical protein
MFSILLTPPAPLVKGGVERETFILGESQFPLLVPPLYQFHKCLLQMML